MITECVELSGGAVAAYLIGSIPFGLLVGRAKGIDIRAHGSGNIGATNVGRLLGLRYFWLTFGLDFMKGFLPVVLTTIIGRHDSAGYWPPLVIAAAAIAGHLYPVYLKFKGGKGVATTFGAVLGIWPIFTFAVLAAVSVFTVVFFLSRIISLSSLCAAVVFPPAVIFAGRWAPHSWHWLPRQPWGVFWPLPAASAVFSLMIIFKHRSNISRLLAGTEKKLSYPAAKPFEKSSGDQKASGGS